MKKIILPIMGFIPPLILIFSISTHVQNSDYAMNTIVLGLLAYSFMLNALYLASKPKWIDNLVGLQNNYLFHIITGIGSVFFAIVHKVVSQASGVTQATGYVALILLILIATFSMPFLNGYLKAHFSVLRKFNKKMASILPHEKIIYIHRLNLVVIILAFIHVSSMTFFRDNILFYFLFCLYTLLAIGSFIFNKIREKFNLHEGIISKKNILNHNTVELIIFVAKNIRNRTIHAGDFVYISFPNHKDLKELHPFSVVETNSYNNGIYLKLAIRADGDFTKSVLSSVVENDTVLVDASYGLIHRKLSHSKMNNLVIIVNGNGITPVISLIQNFLNTDKYKNITLFWSVKSMDDAIYLSDLDELSRIHPNFKIHIKKHRFDITNENMELENPQTSLFVILGSSVVVTSVTKQLKKIKHIKKKQIITEGFSL